MSPGDNDVDQDALAAEWEGALDSEDPEAAAAEAEANTLTETMAEQWAAMVDDGSRNIDISKGGGERVLSLRLIHRVNEGVRDGQSRFLWMLNYRR
jgi:flagellar motor switch protein FliM